MKKAILPEPVILISLAVFLCLAWCFWEIAEEVIEGDTHNIDTAILMMLRNPADLNEPWGPGWFQEMMRDITALGGTAFLWLVTTSVVVYFCMIKNIKHALYLATVVIAGTIISNLLKLGFDRPRPDLMPHGTVTYTASFPSSHSMMSAIVFLSIGALLANAQSSRPLKIYFISLAIFLSVIVGISRIYLGVHWPSDVLAGWIAGTICALLFWAGDRLLSKRTQRNDPA